MSDWALCEYCLSLLLEKREKEVVVARVKESVREGDKMIMRMRQGLLLMNDFIV